ncbi:12440_t:CDS:2, partial [Funneliformis geosporum]
MEFLEFLDRYLKHFPEATPEQVNKAFQISNEHQDEKKNQKITELETAIHILQTVKEDKKSLEEHPEMPGKRKSIESNEFDKKQKLSRFENIINIVKSQRAQLSEMQRDQQNNNIIEHNEDLAVIEKKLLYVRKSY